MSRPSWTGSSGGTWTASSPAGPTCCAPAWRAPIEPADAGSFGLGLLFLGLVVGGAHRLKPLEPLQAVLAAHAGGDLRHGPKPSGCDVSSHSWQIPYAPPRRR